MQEFVPPTSQHLIVFAALVVIGTVAVLYFGCHGTTHTCFESLLTQSVSVLILSTGWTIILVEGKNMFVEAWIERRRLKGLQEGRKDVIEKLRAKIRSTGKPLTEQDIQELEQEITHILPTNSR